MCMMCKLIKSKKRVKELGEVFTPEQTVNIILDNLPDNLFKNKEKTFIDPACGNGNFLVEVLRRKIVAGSTPLQALQTIYGIDIMNDNVNECRKRLLMTAIKGDNGIDKTYVAVLKQNIKCANSLITPASDIFKRSI